MFLKYSILQKLTPVDKDGALKIPVELAFPVDTLIVTISNPGNMPSVSPTLKACLEGE